MNELISAIRILVVSAIVALVTYHLVPAPRPANRPAAVTVEQSATPGPDVRTSTAPKAPERANQKELRMVRRHVVRV